MYPISSQFHNKLEQQKGKTITVDYVCAFSLQRKKKIQLANSHLSPLF